LYNNLLVHPSGRRERERETSSPAHLTSPEAWRETGEAIEERLAGVCGQAGPRTPLPLHNVHESLFTFSPSLMAKATRSSETLEIFYVRIRCSEPCASIIVFEGKLRCLKPLGGGGGRGLMSFLVARGTVNGFHLLILSFLKRKRFCKAGSSQPYLWLTRVHFGIRKATIEAISFLMNLNSFYT
jgi:hypothetical protein